MALRVLLLLLALAALSAPSPAQEGAAERQWSLTATRVVAQHDSEYVQAWGNVTLKSGKNYLKADFARYYQDTRWVYLKGNVQAVWEGDFFQASEAEFDLGQMTGWMLNGKVFVAQPHIYFESALVKKFKGASYAFKDAKLTACSGDNPAWSFSAKEGHITLDGNARLWHSDFKIKGVPVAYAPYMTLPGKESRQSGLLIPDLSQSKRFGANVDLPYYHVLSEERDLTLYERYMETRGFMHGIEYREAPDVETKALWRADYLYDSKTSDDLPENQQFTDTGLNRPNKQRYWLRGKYNGFVSDPSVKVKLDLDFVSDQDYLREFKDGKSGYLQSKDGFIRDFGRSIQESDSLQRTSTALISKSFERVGLSGRMDYTEDVTYKNGNHPASDDPTVQRLPQLDFSFWKNPLLGTPVELQADTQVVHFMRERGSTASRLDAKPMFSLPLSAAGISLIPSLGFRQTSWWLDKIQDEGPQVRNDRTPSRFLPEGGVSAFLEGFNVYSLKDVKPDPGLVGESFWTKLKHTVQPRVEYQYQGSSTEDSRHPAFDPVDSLEGRNRVVYSLTNVLDRRRDSVVQGPGGNGTAALTRDYRDFARIRLEQAYDLNEAGRKDLLDQYSRRPVGDAMGEVVLLPEKWIDLRSRVWVSPYQGAVTEHEHSMRLTREDLGSVSVGYDYQHSINEYTRRYPQNLEALSLGARLFLPGRFILGGEFRKDLASDRELEKTAILTWEHECFTFSFVFTDTSTDKRYSVMFNILNF
jgi:LPS-assembly protein